MMSNRNKLYENIYHIYFTKAFDSLGSHLIRSVRPKGKYLIKYSFIGILSLVSRFVKSWFPPRRQKEVKNKIWIYTHSKNNYDSLSFLPQHLKETIFVAPGIQPYLNQRYYQLYTHDRLKHYWRLPSFIYYLARHKKGLTKNFYLIFSSFGLFESYKRELKKYTPKAIFFANDHNATARALLLAAKSLNIPTIYLQHASITEYFPPLEFDLSLLEGKDTLSKYKKIGNIPGRIELIGMPKFDKFIPYRNFEKNIKNIGISIGLGDDLLKVEELLEKIKNYFPQIRLSIRPHPGESRNIEGLKKLTNYYSDSKKEHVFSFLQKIDINIAANTSTHLEAVLMNIPSLFYPFEENKERYDDYSYVKNKLVDEFKTIESIVQWIEKYKNNRPEVLQKAKYYNSVIGTKFDGKSSELAIKYITAFLKLERNNL